MCTHSPHAALATAKRVDCQLGRMNGEAAEDAPPLREHGVFAGKTFVVALPGATPRTFTHKIWRHVLKALGKWSPRRLPNSPWRLVTLRSQPAHAPSAANHGGTILDIDGSFQPGTDFVVAAHEQQDVVEQARQAGASIVSPAWVLSCVDTNELLDPEEVVSPLLVLVYACSGWGGSCCRRPRQLTSRAFPRSGASAGLRAAGGTLSARSAQLRTAHGYVPTSAADPHGMPCRGGPRQTAAASRGSLTPAECTATRAPASQGSAAYLWPGTLLNLASSTPLCAAWPASRSHCHSPLCST